MNEGALGKEYRDGEVICRQGDRGNCLFIIQAGRVVVSREEGGRQIALGEMGVGDIFGEMAIFNQEPRSATVCARGTARVLTLDRRGFLRRVHEDPSFAYRLLEMMSRRIRELHRQIAASADTSLGA
jgi:CRP-like cAMP-binding protein